jgi:hypothetical protein
LRGSRGEKREIEREERKEGELANVELKSNLFASHILALH